MKKKKKKKKKKDGARGKSGVIYTVLFYTISTMSVIAYIVA